MNTCVFFNFCHDSSQNTRVTQNGLHTSQLSCTASELFLVCCMIARSTRVMLHVLHTNQIPCVLHASEQSSFAWEGSRHTTKSTPAKRDKMYGHEENNVYSIPIHSRWRTSWMPSAIMVQGLDDTATNNLTHLVAQCAHVLYHKLQLKH